MDGGLNRLHVCICFMLELTQYAPDLVTPLFQRCKEKLSIHVEDFPIARAVVGLYVAQDVTPSHIPDNLHTTYPEEFTKKVVDTLNVILSRDTDPTVRISMLDTAIDTW